MRRRSYPGVQLTTDFTEVLRSPDIDAVAIITPVWTHFELAKAALENGKHVFVEKPFTSTSQQAEELIELAERKNLRIMVDHTFLFSGAVRKIRDLVDNGTLGPLYYFDSTRVNLGLFQHDVSVLWDLAPHDLSIMDYLIVEKPEAVVATGGNHLNDLADMAFITVYFPSNVIAHFNVNWLSPVKVRTTLIGGRDKMLVWNDLEPDEKIKVYDKGVEITKAEGVYDLLVSYRSGDVWGPKVDSTEALEGGAGVFHRLHPRRQDAVERRRRRPARRPPARGGGAVAAGSWPARHALDRHVDERLRRLLSLSARSGADRDASTSSLPGRLLQVRRRHCLRARRRRAARGVCARSSARCRADDVTIDSGRPVLPFDLSEVVTNLREERYSPERLQLPAEEHARARRSRRLYYQFRPLLGVGVRKHLQKVRLSGWDKIPFPRWPVDRSVDALMEKARDAAP